MGVQFANNAYSTLASSINSSVTTVTLASGEGARFPAASVASGNYFYVTIIDTSNVVEIVKVTDRTSDVLTVERGADGTTASSFASSDRVELRVVGAALEELRDSERVPPDEAVTIAKLATAVAAYLREESTTAEMRDGTGGVVVTPEVVVNAAAEVTITDAATIALDWETFINGVVTLGASRVLGFPTNVQAGTWRRLRVVQDGTGSRALDFTATGYYSPSTTAPFLPTAAGADATIYLYARTTSIVEVYASGSTWGQIV